MKHFWHCHVLKGLQLKKTAKVTQRIDLEVLIDIYLITGLYRTIIHAICPLMNLVIYHEELDSKLKTNLHFKRKKERMGR
jgi:hypothetical protein